MVKGTGDSIMILTHAKVRSEKCLEGKEATALWKIELKLK